MTADAHDDTTLLHELGRRRAELRTSMGALERALAAPAGGETSVGWFAAVKAALDRLYDDVAEHVAVTEGPGGLYADLAEHSPRLEHAVVRLVEDHVDIRRRLEELITWAEVGNGEAAVMQVRAAALELLVVLMRHRQRGADLVFEAFAVDIGGEN